jgi:hypothetical protein
MGETDSAATPFVDTTVGRRLSDGRHSVAWAITASMAHGHNHVIDTGRPSVTANDRKASNDNTNARDANASVIDSAHPFASPPARVRTSTATERVAAK